MTELEAYKNQADIEAAVPEIERKSLYGFWLANALRLPTFFKCNTESVALLLPTSSGNVERVFAIYGGVIDDDQRRAKEDYREAATVLRYNKAKKI